MMNKIWTFFIISGVVFSLFTGNIQFISDEIISCGETTLSMIMKIFPVMALWLGIMKIAEDSGLLRKMSDFFYPIIRFIFPDIPRNHECVSLISSSFIFNMFGLGNASTPIGLKTMKSLSDLDKGDSASRSMITFLVLNTTGFTIVPTTIISLKMMHGSSNASEIIFPCFLASLISTVGGLIVDRFFARKDRKCH